MADGIWVDHWSKEHLALFRSKILRSSRIATAQYKALVFLALQGLRFICFRMVKRLERLKRTAVLRIAGESRWILRSSHYLDFDSKVSFAVFLFEK